MCVGHLIKNYRQVALDVETFNLNISNCPYISYVNVQNFINFWMLEKNIPAFK